jgi:DNA-binding NarL/FixJ family response regulator
MRTDCVIIVANAGSLAVHLLNIIRHTAVLPVFTAENEGEFFGQLKTCSPRFVFLEDCFYGRATDEFIGGLVKGNPRLRIIVWACSDVRPAIAARYLAAGAESFFSLREDEKAVKETVRRLLEGRPYYPPEVGETLEGTEGNPVIGGGELKRREKEIIKLCIDEIHNKEIARRLGVSLSLVKHYKDLLYKRCGGNTPVDILKFGMLRGIIGPEDLLPGGGGHG